MTASNWIAKHYDESAWFRLGFLLALNAIAVAGMFVLDKATATWAPYCVVPWILAIAAWAAYIATPSE